VSSRVSDSIVVNGTYSPAVSDYHPTHKRVGRRSTREWFADWRSRTRPPIWKLGQFPAVPITILALFGPFGTAAAASRGAVGEAAVLAILSVISLTFAALYLKRPVDPRKPG
jgi:hypothetical protein